MKHNMKQQWLPQHIHAINIKWLFMVAHVLPLQLSDELFVDLNLFEFITFNSKLCNN